MVKNKVESIELIYNDGSGGIKSIWIPKSMYKRRVLMDSLKEYEDKLIGR
jgi:hypothetical protein